MMYILFDLEATCWKNTFTQSAQEIIEIGACKVNRYGECKDQFNSFVKPKNNAVLSLYCKQLTNIEQKQIDTAPYFDEVIEDFKDWINIDESEYVLCSWGEKDQKFLISDCNEYGLPTSWLNNFIDLKQQYNNLKGQSKPLSLDKTFEKENIIFEGLKHRALSDALNLAKLFIKYFDQWPL